MTSVTVYALPTVSASVSSSVICFGQPVTLSGSGANTYTWTSSAPGSYTDNVAFNPSVTASYPWWQHPPMVVSAPTPPLLRLPWMRCQLSVPRLRLRPSALGQTVSLIGSGAGTYTEQRKAARWLTSMPLRLRLQPVIRWQVPTPDGLYQHQQSACGGYCKYFTDCERKLFTADICIGSSVTLNGGGANTYTLDGFGGKRHQQRVPFSPTTTASYSVMVPTPLTGCTSTNNAVTSVTVYALPTVSASVSSSVICFDSQLPERQRG